MIISQQLGHKSDFEHIPKRCISTAVTDKKL